MTRMLALALLALGLAPSNLLAWGQCTHACLTFDTLEKHGAEMPKVATDPATKDTYIHASYSPDMYVLQGPEYVHLDREFSLLLFKHAKTARQLAVAYGWSTHQEEDSVGHGRYITEVGLPHMYKEMVMDSRFLFQGSKGESDTVKHAGAAWDAEMIEAASRDYSEKYGSKYPVISQAMANTTGYVFSAYITALKATEYALWYGRVKWHSDLYPRSEWQGYVAEAVDQAHKWCADPFSFSGSSAETANAAMFKTLFVAPAQGEEVAPAGDLTEVNPDQTLANIANAVAGYDEHQSKMPRVSAFGGKGPEGEVSHVMLQQARFIKLGQKLLTTKNIKVQETGEGAFHEVRTQITSKRKFLADVARLLKETSAVDARVAPGASGTMDGFFSDLQKDAEKGSQDAPEEPEN